MDLTSWAHALRDPGPAGGSHRRRHPRRPPARALLTLLLLDAGRTVSAQRLVDGLYGTRPPAGAANALQSQISRLRRRLAPHTAIEAPPAGYRIVTAPDTVDAHRSRN
ncbi:AfsR/SARP family transcriptional regulator [Streptomyces sp. NPDC001139]